MIITVYFHQFIPYFVTINAFLANYWQSTSCPVEHAKFQCMAIQVLAVLYLICHQLVSYMAIPDHPNSML